MILSPMPVRRLSPPPGPEEDIREGLVAAIGLDAAARARINARAALLIEQARSRRRPADLDSFLTEYRLSTREGVTLMALAEALLRIPDAATADRLIQDKLATAEWEGHRGHSPSPLVNASTWALMLTGRLLAPPEDRPDPIQRLGGPLLRAALKQAMALLGRHFVMGRTIAEALARAQADATAGYGQSFDMLGEAARTTEAAEAYAQAYTEAIAAIGAAAAGRGPQAGPGISVKLSALHPRYEMAQRDRVLAELLPRLLELCRAAAAVNIGLTIDAEEADRLELSLELIGRVMAAPDLAGWDGFGLAVQAYQRRARPLIAWLAEQTASCRRRLMVRLVKGAYWDTEIKRAQERGLAEFPVFTTKAATDLSYLACAADLLARPDLFYPQFATHNAHSVAAIAEMAGDRDDWEYQRLHGMGETLYDQIVPGRACRVYAPVGGHGQLLPYLVRRLLENGANSSFVNHLADPNIAAADALDDPFARPAGVHITAPPDLFAPARRNSLGLDLADPAVLAALDHQLQAAAARDWRAGPDRGPARPVLDPADTRRVIGHVVEAVPADIAAAAGIAQTAFPDWDGLGGDGRATRLEAAADVFEAHRGDLVYLALREAGKTIPDALAEVREAVDVLRYYAAAARAGFGPPACLPGPVGERNTLALGGRGVFACISPWNFPLAIFTGQVAAALAAGNCVLAKPAPQTPLMAALAVRLMHQAGIPPEVLHLLPGEADIGRALVADPHVAGVAFTGSGAGARAINRALAARDGAISPLIAETGGINAMIVDASALVEQVVADVIDSAFRSAGQRCSALRVLFVQEDCWRPIVAMLGGAMIELRLGDPARLATDIGPVIDAAAKARLADHAAGLGRPLGRAELGPGTGHGHFVAPMAFEISAMDRLTHEVFGPILHLVRWSSGHLDRVIEDVNRSGYGLTLGIHSRIDATIAHVIARARVGNVYVNRSMIGAVVGSQPFGGMGLSGTGPKAGGPHLLPRYGVEKAVSVNTAAAGGDVELLSLPPQVNT